MTWSILEAIAQPRLPCAVGFEFSLDRNCLGQECFGFRHGDSCFGRGLEILLVDSRMATKNDIWCHWWRQIYLFFLRRDTQLGHFPFSRDRQILTDAFSVDRQRSFVHDLIFGPWIFLHTSRFYELGSVPKLHKEQGGIPGPLKSFLESCFTPNVQPRDPTFINIEATLLRAQTSDNKQ